MTRTRLAVLLGVLATLAVVATAAVAVTTYDRDEADAGTLPEPVVVADPASGATFELPAGDWTVRAPDERISYDDAHVLGAALLDEDYCHAQPEGSFRALAGFTDQAFDTWVTGVAGRGPAWLTGTSSEKVTLANGTPATYSWRAMSSAPGPCADSGIEVAMVRAGAVRAVIVADSGDDGTLSHESVREILLGLQLS